MEKIWQYVCSRLVHKSPPSLTYCCKVKRDRATFRQILSKKAIEIISGTAYNDHSRDAREPPYMRPSTDAEDYSPVCVATTI